MLGNLYQLGVIKGIYALPSDRGGPDGRNPKYGSWHYADAIYPIADWLGATIFNLSEEFGLTGLGRDLTIADPSTLQDGGEAGPLPGEFPGDVDFDGDIDINDANELHSRIGEVALPNSDIMFFDYNGNGSIDRDDRDFLLSFVLQRDIGDFDDSGVIDAFDVIQLSRGQAIVAGNATYTDGDLNGDGSVDATDVIGLLDESE